MTTSCFRGKFTTTPLKVAWLGHTTIIEILASLWNGWSQALHIQLNHNSYKIKDEKWPLKLGGVSIMWPICRICDYLCNFVTSVATALLTFYRASECNVSFCFFVSAPLQNSKAPSLNTRELENFENIAAISETVRDRPTNRIPNRKS